MEPPPILSNMRLVAPPATINMMIAKRTGLTGRSIPLILLSFKIKDRRSEAPDAPSRRHFFLSMLHASKAAVGSIAVLPSSMCLMIPSLSITNVARIPNPVAGLKMP